MTVIRAGPVGLYAAHYAGFRGMRTAIVDSLPEPGGQIAAQICSDLRIAADLVPWRDDNAAFFDQALPGRDEPLGSPGGAGELGKVDADAPLAAVTPATAASD